MDPPGGKCWRASGGAWTSITASRSNGVRSLELALATLPAGDEQVLVRFHADVREQRMVHAWWVAGGAVAGTGTGGALLLVDPVTLLASLPFGAGVAFGGLLAGRSYYRREVSKIETVLAGLLDRLEHRPAAAVGAFR